MLDNQMNNVVADIHLRNSFLTVGESMYLKDWLNHLPEKLSIQKLLLNDLKVDWKRKTNKPVCCNITSMCQYSVKKADNLSNIELESWWHNINTEKSVRDYQDACNPMRDRRPAVAMKSTWANGDTWCLNKTFAYPSPLLPETRKFPLTEIMLRLDMCDWTSLYICIL